MQTSLKREPRDRLQEYVDGVTTLDQLKDWLVAMMWEIDRRSDDSATMLLYEVQLVLADQSSGLTTEDETREELTRLARLVRVA
jgi:hypothetical protein